MAADDIAAALRESVPGMRLVTGSGTREYGKDEGFARLGRTYLPDVVALPDTAEQVSAVLRLANDQRVAVVPWGSGTSLEGQGLAIAGGITLDMRGLNRVRRVLADDFQVEVEAGILYPALNDRLRREGLFFPPNPGAPATIGGMINNNSSGSTAVKYGVTRDYVMQLDCVLADGSVAKFGTRARKTTSGYDLVDLVVGSAGTLCVVTSAVLRVAATPDVTVGLIAAMPDMGAAGDVVASIMGQGFTPATLEALDGPVVAVLNQVSPLGITAGAVLLIQCDGHEQAAVRAEASGIAAAVAAGGGRVLDRSVDDFSAILKARKTLGWDLVRLTGMRTLKLVDAAVPLSAYAEMVRLVHVVLAEHRLDGYVFGHAGDGNLHVIIASDWREGPLWQRTLDAERQITEMALQHEGTITGEHGIGLAKRDLLPLEHGSAMGVMRAVKSAFDPKGILNPGKIL